MPQEIFAFVVVYVSLFLKVASTFVAFVMHIQPYVSFHRIMSAFIRAPTLEMNEVNEVDTNA